MRWGRKGEQQNVSMGREGQQHNGNVTNRLRILGGRMPFQVYQPPCDQKPVLQAVDAVKELGTRQHL